MVLDAAADNPLAHLLSLLGIGGDAALPPLPLAETLAAGRGPIVAWLRALGSDPSAVEAWLGHLAGLLGLDPLGAVSGDGTAAAPLAVALPAGAAEVAFTLVLGTAAATGDPVLRPGLRVRLPAPAGVPGPGRGGRRARRDHRRPGPRRQAAAGRPRDRAHRARRAARDRRRPAGRHDGRPGSPCRSRRWRRAWRSTATAGRCWCSPPSTSRSADDTHPVVDLTMPDAVLEVAAGALDEVIDRLLAALGASDEATALLALLGLRRPGSLDPGAAVAARRRPAGVLRRPAGRARRASTPRSSAPATGERSPSSWRALLGVGPAAAVAGSGIGGRSVDRSGGHRRDRLGRARGLGRRGDPASPGPADAAVTPRAVGARRAAPRARRSSCSAWSSPRATAPRRCPASR